MWARAAELYWNGKVDVFLGIPLAVISIWNAIVKGLGLLPGTGIVLTTSWNLGVYVWAVIGTVFLLLAFILARYERSPVFRIIRRLKGPGNPYPVLRRSAVITWGLAVLFGMWAGAVNVLSAQSRVFQAVGVLAIVFLIPPLKLTMELR